MKRGNCILVVSALLHPHSWSRCSFLSIKPVSTLFQSTQQFIFFFIQIHKPCPFLRCTSIFSPVSPLIVSSTCSHSYFTSSLNAPQERSSTLGYEMQASVRVWPQHPIPVATYFQNCNVSVALLGQPVLPKGLVEDQGNNTCAIVSKSVVTNLKF